MPKLKYTSEIREFIKENIKGVKYKDMALLIKQKFNLSVNPDALAQWCVKNNMQNGVVMNFEKGHTPFNKGKKWDDYLTKEQQAKSRQTCFSSERIVNHQDHTWYHKVGDERLDKDGYVMIKLYEHAKDNGGGKGNSTRAWVLKHRYIWEQNYGPIPEGHIVIFLDGNRLNFEIDNLGLISQRENALINKYGLRYDDPDLTKLGINIAKLKLLIIEKGKGKNEQHKK